ncbi:hypothetical protein AWC25_19400 [Mycobacterium sherrisii]|uniref:Uncharacterized protein n=1 Tax=Mycobacterium sherrisii TaxID=243061 RepID=A0A1E3SI17_9MYCO|nr:hypothetical protein BHQ21_23190 [Mycobacterium sherrisii]ORW72204.1 hypothetical protein AWC25_19400 [Mycobacterium sherrisii]
MGPSPVPTGSVSFPMCLVVDPRPAWETSLPSDVGLIGPATGPSTERTTTVGSDREDRPAPAVADDEPLGLSVGVIRDPPPAASGADTDTRVSPPGAAESDDATGPRILSVSESPSPAAKRGPPTAPGVSGETESLPRGAGSCESGTAIAVSRCSSRC